MHGQDLTGLPEFGYSCRLLWCVRNMIT